MSLDIVFETLLEGLVEALLEPLLDTIFSAIMRSHLVFLNVLIYTLAAVVFGCSCYYVYSFNRINLLALLALLAVDTVLQLLIVAHADRILPLSSSNHNHDGPHLHELTSGSAASCSSFNNDSEFTARLNKYRSQLACAQDMLAAALLAQARHESERDHDHHEPVQKWQQRADTLRAQVDAHLARKGRWIEYCVPLPMAQQVDLCFALSRMAVAA